MDPWACWPFLVNCPSFRPSTYFLNEDVIHFWRLMSLRVFVYLGQGVGAIPKIAVPIPAPKPPCPQTLGTPYQFLGATVGSERTTEL